MVRKRVIVHSMPMSDWLEPARDKDNLLVLPSNKRRKATNIWHEELREEVHKGASQEPFGSGTATDSQPSHFEPQHPNRAADAANDKTAFVKLQASAPSPDDSGVALTEREVSATWIQGSDASLTEQRASRSSSNDSEMALTQADISPSDKSEATTARLDSVMHISESEEAKADKDPQPIRKVIKATKKAAGKVRTFVPDSEEDSDYEELSDREDWEDEESEDEPDSKCRSPSNSQPLPQSTSKKRPKVFRDVTESSRQHPTDATKIIITYTYRLPTGGTYIQETTTPKPLDILPTTPSPSSIIFPDVETAKVPRTLENAPWTPVPGSQNHNWTRGAGPTKETWRVTMFFRRLSRSTYTHHDTYHSPRAVLETDPNSARFRSWYNKWILQFARRHDNSYTQRVTRVHWSAGERRVLYTQINLFCARFGLHKFSVRDGGLLKAQRDAIAAAVNNAQNPRRSEPRNADAVRSQIATARGGRSPKNQAVFELLGRADEVRRRIAAGERVARTEQFPRYAIPLELFPGDASDGEGQREGGVSEREDDSSGLSSPPESEDEL